MANEDPRYLKWIRSLACLVCNKHGVHAHHSPFGKGMGQRSHDHTAVPLCHEHHRDFHDCLGHFAGWDKAKRKRWTADRFVELRCLYEGTALYSDPPGVPFDPLKHDIDDIF